MVEYYIERIMRYLHITIAGMSHSRYIRILIDRIQI